MENKRPPIYGVINTITGATQEWAMSKSKRNAHLRNVQTMATGAPSKKLSEEIKWQDNWTVTFSAEEMDLHQNSGNDPIVVKAIIGNYEVSRILIDNDSDVDIIMYKTFISMGFQKSALSPSTLVYGFTNQPIPVKGTITLPIRLGDGEYVLNLMNTFLVMDISTPYNALIGRPLIKTARLLDAVCLLSIKFPEPTGIGYMKTNQAIARSCHLTSLALTRKSKSASEEAAELNMEVNYYTGGQQKQNTSSRMEINMPNSHPYPNKAMLIGKGQTPSSTATLLVKTLDVRDEQTFSKAQPVEQTLCIQLCEDDKNNTTHIGSLLKPEKHATLVYFLKKNMDVFAWCPKDMPGINPQVMTHKLNVDPKHRPVKQKKRKFAPDRLEAIREEVDKLLAAGFIREVQYPDWVVNVVMVKKTNGKWRMCVDFTDLNKACPKDSFPLPSIDRLVDASSGNRLLSFMDAFSGYNQIPLEADDKEKTAFITKDGLYCYLVMPFGLKNAGATYQRLVNKIFKDLIG